MSEKKRTGRMAAKIPKTEDSSTAPEPFSQRLERDLTRMSNEVVPKSLTTKQFRHESHLIERALEEALREYPTEFRQAFSTIARIRSAEETKSALKAIKAYAPSLVPVLMRYVVFSRRFGVETQLHNSPPHFIMEPSIWLGNKMSVKAVRGKLIPSRPSQGDGEFVDIADPHVKVPAGFDKVAEKFPIRWLEVAGDGSTTLEQIRSVAYDPQSLTFVSVKSNPPVLWCIIGENLDTTTWAQAGKIRTRFQREQFGTGKAGRPINDERRIKQLQQLSESTSMDVMAASLPGVRTATQVDSMARQLRYIKADLKKRSKD
jgi:hypothetical protein